MFTKEKFELFRGDVQEALAAISEKYCVDINTGNITYNSNSFSLQLKATMKEVNGKPYEQAQFEKYCAFYDFKPSDYKKKFLFKGAIYTLIGFNPKARKMPIEALSENGGNYKFAIAAVKNLQE